MDKLSSKQESILIQSQLMGLTAYDLACIAKRLTAQEQADEFKSDVALITQGLTWVTNRRHEKYTFCDTNHNIEYTFVRSSNSSLVRTHAGQWVVTSNVGVGIPSRTTWNHVSLFFPARGRVKWCPDNDKVVYSIARSIYLQRYK